MATMKQCRAQLSVSGAWGTEHYWPGLEVDVDRELAPGVTVGQAIAGREECFEDVVLTAVGEPAPGGFTHTVVPEGTDLSTATVRPIRGKATTAAPPPQE